MKCVSYTRTLPWKNHQSKLTIAEQNQRIAAFGFLKESSMSFRFCTPIRSGLR